MNRLLKNGNGSALFQVILVSAFVMMIAFAIGDWINRRNKFAFNQIERAAYSELGESVAAEIAPPSVTFNAQSVRTDTLYP